MLALEQVFNLIEYASTVIFELHYDEAGELAGTCLRDSCLHVKIQWNKITLFSELPFCDYKTGKCPYSAFKAYIEARYLQNIDSDEICYAPFDPLSAKYHRVQIV